MPAIPSQEILDIYGRDCDMQGIGADVVRDALHLRQTGKRPPGRLDGRRRRPRQPGQPLVPRYRQFAAEVDQRRRAGKGSAGWPKR